MNTPNDPVTVHPPIGGLYTHCRTVPAGSHMMFISGQIGADRSGKTITDLDAQFDQAWRNVFAILRDGGMGIKDIVKVTCFLGEAEYADAYATSCQRHLGDHKPAMTAAVVQQLWTTDWYFEFDVVAARSDKNGSAD